jgi:predicted dehydrogenase
MNILIIGNGFHTNKRIVPSLLDIEKVRSIDIVYRSTNKTILNHNKIKYFNIEDDSLNPEYSLVVYATPPSEHINNFYKYFNFSENHLIEKPITTGLKEIKSPKFKKLYSEKNVFESLMYLHHPVIKVIKETLSNLQIQEIKTSFKVPHQDSSHHRYSKKKGGGSILDQGIYPISLITYLFGSDIQIISKEVNFTSHHEVDLSGHIDLISRTGFSIRGEWALGEKYENYLEIRSQQNVYNFPFIFSKNEADEYKYSITDSHEKHIKNLGHSNQFNNMYTSILNGKYLDFEYSSYENLLKRYELLDKITEGV